MIVAVLDTNVLAAGFIGEKQSDSAPGALLRLRRWSTRRFTLVISEHILAELADTFTDPYFTQRLSPLAVADALDPLRVDGNVQQITVEVRAVREREAGV